LREEAGERREMAIHLRTEIGRMESQIQSMLDSADKLDHGKGRLGLEISPSQLLQRAVGLRDEAAHMEERVQHLEIDARKQAEMSQSQEFEVICLKLRRWTGFVCQ
jgi:hypothetical protein